jgi:tRNA nucleotidyltransferase/poly(A) polymerase
VIATSPSQTPHSVADAEWFRRPQLRAIFAALNRDGHEACIVGGALRNTLMGLPVGDVDFAATATPEEIIRFAGDAGLKPVPTGIGHGTITIVAQGTPFEVTTLRRDVETHGRHATVAFTRDWAADAARRDFTINALYAPADGRIFDPLGGIADIHARRVRFIGSAHERIREDYLRILRFFRFTADYTSGPPDAEGLAACIRERAGLAKLSAERVRAELLRILVTRDPPLALEPMAGSGLLIAILGGLVRLSHFSRMAAIEARLDVPPDAIRRLAALAIMIEEDAARLAKRLRLSKAEAARLAAMAARQPLIDAGLNGKAARVALYRLGEAAYRDRVLVSWSRAADGAPEEDWRGLYSLPDRWRPGVMPLTGQDLIAHGVAPGPDMGETLRLLEDRWIESDFTLSRTALLESLAR